jgi:DNA adenine methylase
MHNERKEQSRFAGIPPAEVALNGGKSYLAKEIISRFPKHVHYVEPFFGGGAVLFAKPNEWIEGHSEVVNDLNRELSNFWSVLQCDEAFQVFQKMCEATPFSQDEWRRADFRGHDDPDHIFQAFLFFVAYRQSRQGLGKDFATLSRNRTRRGMNEQVSSWLSSIDGLPEAHERLKRVVILNDDAMKVIKQQDGPNTLFYCDPPYMHETRVTTSGYEHEMCEEGHFELLGVLSSIQGKFILSGYHSFAYDDSANLHDWRCDEIAIDNKASSAKTKEIKTECLWMNF